MASFISRLLSRFNKQQKRTKNNRNRNRRLRVEHMEMRRLLAGDMGAIAGNVYTDLTDDGLDVGDTPQANVSVFLYRDGGNGTFESGAGTAGGDDVLIGTETTDGSGDYRFDELIEGTYFVEQEPVSGLLQRASEQVKTVAISASQATGVETVNIDDFDTTPTSPDPLTATAGTTVSDQMSTAAGETLGGERDLVINNLSGANDIDVRVNTGLLSINAGSGTSGNVIISYDGIDGDASTLDHTTLGPVDLTVSNGEAFHFLVGSEAGNSLTIDVYSGSGNFSSVTLPLPVTAGGSATEDMIVRFSNINNITGTGADFSAVTAIRFQIDVAAGADAEVNFTRAVAPDVTTTNFANLNPMSLGDLVFNDSNDNGVFDSGESGIGGVTVELYEDTNLNGVYDDGIDTLVGTPQVTDVDGRFVFENLFPGEYIQLIPISQFPTSSDPLFGFVPSSGTAPDPDIAVVDNDNNGTLIAGVGVATAAVTLASGSEPTNDGDSDPNSNLTVDFGFAPQIDLAVAKTASGSTITAGDQLTYTITVSNNGDGPANNVLLIDDLPDLTPDGLTIVATSATGGGVVTETGNATGEVEIAYATLASGQTETITITVGVPATADIAAAITNSVTVTGDGVDTDATNNTATVDVAIEREAVLTLTKSDSPDPVSVGGTLTYELVVTNTGPSSATNVVVSDTLPTGLTFQSVSTTAGTSSEAAGVVTANIPTLAAGASATITIVSVVEASFSGTTLSNSATADADEAVLVNSSEDTTVTPSVDLSITKSDSEDPIGRGEELTYTLIVSNAGPSDATNVELVDTLPAGVTFVSATGGTVTPPSGSSTDVLVAVGDIASGGTATVTIVVTVEQAASGTLSNTAIVRSTETLDGFDSNTSNNTVTETTATQGSIDLAITKADSADPVVPGESFTYTLVVINNGPTNATGVTVTDNLPDGIQVTSATSTVGTVTVPASADDTTPANNDDLTVDVGNLASGATATITIVATVLPATTGTLSNVATVSTTDSNLVDTDTSNNSDTETTTLSPSVDLRVTKTDSTDPIVAGNSLTYTITVTNDGPSTATGVTLSDTLPSGVTFTSVTASQGTASHASGVVTGALGTLAPGASATVTLIVGVNPATRGTLSNTASVTASQTDSDTSNNSATSTTTVNGSIDLAITKADSTDPVSAGGSLTYTIVVTNNGPSTATNVVVSDTLPSQLTFASGTSTVGTVSNASGVVTANVGTLASGASATITIVTNVSSSATGSLSNTASVTGTETDTNTANNSATQSTSVTEPGSIAGTVYLDANRNGVRDSGEEGIPGVTITLTGTATGGASVNRQTTTDSSGNYLFDALLPGTYQLTQSQPSGFGDGSATVGTGATGTAGTNQITNITLASGSDATGFNFGEVRSALSKRRFLASSIVND